MVFSDIKLAHAEHVMYMTLPGDDEQNISKISDAGQVIDGRPAFLDAEEDTISDAEVSMTLLVALYIQSRFY
jgi:hypothetical protein